MRLALTTLLLASALTGCMTQPLGSGQAEKENAEYAQALDMVSAALKANMAVVLVADLNPDKSLSDGPGMTKWTSLVYWSNEARPDIVFNRKFQNNALQRDPKETYLFKAFEIHILPPGKYLLTGADDYRLNASLSDVKAQPGKALNGASVTLTPERYREYYTEEVWKDATTHTETGVQKVCTAVHRASGNCVSWGEQQTTQTSAGMGAGYYQQTDSRDIPALKLQMRVPAQAALASFTLKGGQLVLAQRSYVKTPSYSFRQGGCRKTGSEQIECPLDSFTVHTRPAPMEFARNYIQQRATISAEHEQLLSRMEPMRITPLVKPGADEPIWGTPLTWRSGR